MAHTYQETEYLYSSARVRFMENALANRERFLHLSEVPTSDAVLAALPELGFEILRKESGEIDREETLLSPLRYAYREISAMSPAPLVDFLRYPYDAHNVKSILKCRARGISAQSMLIDLGTVSPDVLMDAMREQDYSLLPAHIANAIPTAIEEFAKSANPQVIDLILDRATYADMHALALASGLPYLVQLSTAKIDLINLITCVRILRMKLSSTAMPLMQSAYLESGSFGIEKLCHWIEEQDEKGFWEWLSHTNYASLAPHADMPLWQLERNADNAWMQLAKEAKQVSFGAPVLLGYLIAMEYQVKNIRIILAGKDASLSSEVIRERMRESYV